MGGAEFLLEGMYAHKRLSRSEERGFSAQEKATRKQERVEQDAITTSSRSSGEPVAALTRTPVILPAHIFEDLWMKRIRYTKYTGDPASEMSMEDMLKALSEYLLDSGFQDPWSRFAELDGEHTLDNLREALRQALEAGDLFDGEMQQRIDEMVENGELDELIEKIIERMEQENYISTQGRQDPNRNRPAARPAWPRARYASK